MFMLPVSLVWCALRLVLPVTAETGELLSRLYLPIKGHQLVGTLN